MKKVLLALITIFQFPHLHASGDETSEEKKIQKYTVEKEEKPIEDDSCSNYHNLLVSERIFTTEEDFRNFREETRQNYTLLQRQLDWALAALPVINSKHSLFEYRMRGQLTQLFTRKFLRIPDSNDPTGLFGLAISLSGDSASIVNDCFTVLNITGTIANSIPIISIATTSAASIYSISDIIYNRYQDKLNTLCEKQESLYFSSLSHIEKVSYTITQALMLIYAEQIHLINEEDIQIYSDEMINTIKMYMDKKTSGITRTGNTVTTPITPNEIIISLASFYNGNTKNKKGSKKIRLTNGKIVRVVDLLLSSPMHLMEKKETLVDFLNQKENSVYQCKRSEESELYYWSIQTYNKRYKIYRTGSTNDFYILPPRMVWQEYLDILQKIVDDDNAKRVDGKRELKSTNVADFLAQQALIKERKNTPVKACSSSKSRRKKIKD